MPPSGETDRRAVLQRVALVVGVYPIEAYEFVQRGLGYTVEKIHGPAKPPPENRHVSGQQLCEGLREYALEQWGMLARTVLRRWNITATLDFGRIVFSLVEHKVMKTTEEDDIEDFRNVYDFKNVFEAAYRIASKV
jgi:uncharacterized repeat protein (TIGR04138 family)